MAVMGDARKANALAVQLLLKDAKAALNTAKTKLGDAADLMLAQQTIEQDKPVNERVPDAATMSYRAYGVLDGLSADARRLRADVVTAHAGLSLDLSKLFSDADEVTHSTINGPGAGRR